MPKAFTSALGCKVSHCDNAEAEKLLAAAGFELIKDPKDANLCLITACTVTQKADADLRKLVRRCKKANPQTKVFVYGCWANIAERHEPIEELDGVIKGKEKLEELIKPLAAVPQAPPASSRNRAFIKVQDGCNRFCAYCIVPFARGNPKSVPFAEVKAQVLEAQKAGLLECVLSGIHLAAWREGEKDIADLCAGILKETDLPRLRVSSLDVTGASKKLRRLMQENPRLLPQLHIPLQSGSDRVLKLMNRPVARGEVLDAMAAFLEEVPRMMISTDIIVGFPGESEEDFSETLSFVEKIPFGKVHYFPYSPRPGTAAAQRTKDFIPASVKKEREERLRLAAEKAAARCRAPFVGQTFRVLTENKSAKGWLGFTENYLRVCSKRDLKPNQIVELKIDNKETVFVSQ